MSKPKTATTDAKMTKLQLIAAVSRSSGQSQVVVRAVLDAATDVITDTLVAGAEPYGLGLGRFTTVVRPPKKARDIRRGVQITVPERISVSFKPNQGLALAVNGGRE